MNPETTPEPEGEPTPNLSTISAGGFTATVDAYATYDREIYFLSMVGSQTSLKAIWATLLKQPPDNAHITEGVGMDLGKTYRVNVPKFTIGTWTTKIQRLKRSTAYHALVYSRICEYAYIEKAGEKNFVIFDQYGVAESDSDTNEDFDGDAYVADLYYHFLNKRTTLPLHKDWAPWLWLRAGKQRYGRGSIKEMNTGSEIQRAFLCDVDNYALGKDITKAIVEGELKTTTVLPTRRQIEEAITT